MLSTNSVSEKGGDIQTYACYHTLTWFHMQHKLLTAPCLPPKQEAMPYLLTIASSCPLTSCDLMTQLTSFLHLRISTRSLTSVMSGLDGLMSMMISTWKALNVENKGNVSQRARNFQLSTFFQSIIFPVSGQLIKMLEVIPDSTTCAKQTVKPHMLKQFYITMETKCFFRLIITAHQLSLHI